MNGSLDTGSIPVGSTKANTYELCVTWYKCVFSINVEIPQR